MKRFYSLLFLSLSLLFLHPAQAQDFNVAVVDTAFQATVGAAWGDADGDGDLDVYVANWRNEPDQLLINDGAGNFTGMPIGPGFGNGRSSIGARWIDTEGDGDFDLIIVTLNGASYHYENLGELNFEETVLIAGNYRTIDATDFDLDGDLDLVAAARNNEPNRLLENIGDGTYVLVEDSPISIDTGDSGAVCFADIDGDGDEDVLIQNRLSEDFLYRNEGGTFVRVLDSPIVGSTPGIVSGCVWGDFDNDGDLDLYTTYHDDAPNWLYWNAGDGTFTAEVDSPVISEIGDAEAATAADIDNDGDLDLLPVNSTHDNYLYRNDGAGNFTRDTTSVLDQPEPSSETGFSANWGDADGDGDLDLFAGFDTDFNFLYRNEQAARRWLQVHLLTESANLHGLGAWISVKADIAGTPTWQHRMVRPEAENGQDALAVHFGLDEATAVDSLVVRWPGDATPQVLTNVTIDQVLTIEQGASPLSLTLTPPQDPIVIAPEGGQFVFDIELTHDLPDRHRILGWSIITMPDNTTRERGPYRLTLSAGDSLLRSLRQGVPSTAPSGAYTYTMRFELVEGGFSVEASFPFTKAEGTGTTSTTEWEAFYEDGTLVQDNDDWNNRVVNTEEMEAPHAFVLHANYPNPFNPTTTLTFDLPEMATVEVQVFDLLGRQVRTWSLGGVPAGTGHQFRLEATNWASGVYLYRVIAHGSQGTHIGTGRMLLLK